MATTHGRHRHGRRAAGLTERCDGRWQTQPRRNTPGGCLSPGTRVSRERTRGRGSGTTPYALQTPASNVAASRPVTRGSWATGRGVQVPKGETLLPGDTTVPLTGKQDRHRPGRAPPESTAEKRVAVPAGPFILTTKGRLGMEQSMSISAKQEAPHGISYDFCSLGLKSMENGNDPIVGFRNEGLGHRTGQSSVTS